MLWTGNSCVFTEFQDRFSKFLQPLPIDPQTFAISWKHICWNCLLTFFLSADMDWEQLEQRKVRPPFRPRVVSSTFMDFFEVLLKILILLCNFREAHVMLSILTRNLHARSRCWHPFPTTLSAASTRTSSPASPSSTRSSDRSGRSAAKCTSWYRRQRAETNFFRF